MSELLGYLDTILWFILKVFILPPTSIVGWVMVGVIIRLVRNLTCAYCRSKASMKGKTVVITGASMGMGLETAKDLARRGATIILTCINITKAYAAREDIINTTNAKVEVHHLDVSSMASVRKFAKVIQNRKVDILINNAGIADAPQKITDEGLERTVATNYLGHFLLTHLLMTNLKEASGRIIHVSSVAHASIKDGKELDLENGMRFEYNRPMKTLEIYRITKFLNVLFSNELHRRLKGTGVTSNAVYPGIVNTNIFGYMIQNVWYGFFVRLFVKFYAKSPFQGAQTTILVAVSEELKNVSGKYFEDCKEAVATDLTFDVGLAKKVWEVSERLVKMQPHEQTI